MADLAYTVVDLPPVWPGKRTSFPGAAKFKSQWSKTLHLLGRELAHLRAKKVEIALDLPRGLLDLRQDGMLKADARPKHPVIVSFLDRDGQRQAYPCDRFAWWQDNLYAIAIVLEDLRRAERYGVQSALIRAGFKALPVTATITLSAENAASIINDFSGGVEGSANILHMKDFASRAVRKAVFRTHPDRNDGDRRNFDSVQEAKRVLEARHGGAL